MSELNEKHVKTRIVHKHDLEKHWDLAAGFVPKQGELIIYDIEVDADGNILPGALTDAEGNYILKNEREKPYTYERFKIGDGITKVKDLPFAAPIAQGLCDGSTITGINTTAGCRGFNVTAISPVGYDSVEVAPESMTLTLDSVEGLVEGDICSLAINKNYMDFGKITSISGNTLTIDSYPDDLTAAIVDSTTIGSGDRVSFLFVAKKQDIGTSLFCSAQHAEGWDTYALMTCAHAEGNSTIASGKYSHAEGDNTFAGYAAHAEGQRSTAIGGVSHAEGSNTTASGTASHAEGQLSTAAGNHSHAEGYDTDALGNRAHSEGYKTTAEGIDSHAEGSATKAIGNQSHAEGQGAEAHGWTAHAEGYKTQATKNKAHAEGGNTTASGETAHAEGHYTVASGYASHAEGYSSDPTNDKLTQATAKGAHAEGTDTLASGIGAHAEGCNTVAQGEKSHAEGFGTTASGEASHAEGCSTTATGDYSHSEGNTAKAYAKNSHAEGLGTTTGSSTESNKADGAHAEGRYTAALGQASHAEGNSTVASGAHSHAEGTGTNATYSRAHAEGWSTQAIADSAHAEGKQTIAGADFSHAEGEGTKATSKWQHVQGCYNVADPTGTNSVKGTYAHIVGNGTSEEARSNAHTLDWKGNAWYAGRVTVGENKEPLVKASEVASIQDTINTANVELTNLEKRVNTIENAAEGTIYNYVTDSTSAYKKVVPDASMSNAIIKKVGSAVYINPDSEITFPYVYSFSSMDEDLTVSKEGDSFVFSGVSGENGACVVIYDAASSPEYLEAGEYEFVLKYADGSAHTMWEAGLEIYDRDNNYAYVGGGTVNGYTNVRIPFSIPESKYYIIILRFNLPGAMGDIGTVIVTPMFVKKGGGIVKSPVTSIRSNNIYNIPNTVTSMDGYGLGISDTLYNYIDFEEKTFVQMVAEREFKDGDANSATMLTDRTTTIYALNNKNVVDISDKLTFDGSIDVTAGNYVFVQNALELNIPSVITFAVKIDEYASKEYVENSLSGKVSKETDTTKLGNFGGLYGISTTGEETTFKVTNQTGSGSIPIRGTGGVIVGGTPTADSHLATKGYVDTTASTKVDEWDGATGGYMTLRTRIHKTSGDETLLIRAHNQPLASAIATWNTQKQLSTEAPTGEKHCTNKKYVDNAVIPLQTQANDLERRLANVEQAAKGNIYDFITDDSADYKKTVPSIALPYAMIEKVGSIAVKGGATLPNGYVSLNSGDGMNGEGIDVATVSYNDKTGVYTFTGYLNNAGAVLTNKLFLDAGFYSFFIAECTSEIWCLSVTIYDENDEVLETLVSEYSPQNVDFTIPDGGAYVTLSFSDWGAMGDMGTQTVRPALICNNPYIKKSPITAIKSYGKNLFDESEITYATSSTQSQDTKFGVVEDGYLKAKYGAYGTTVLWAPFTTHLEAGSYTVSCDVYIGSESPTLNLVMGLSQGKGSAGMYIRQRSVDGFDQWYRVTNTFNNVEEGDYFFAGCGGGNASNYNRLNVRFKNIQVERGTTATDFSPYLATTYNIPQEVLDLKDQDEQPIYGVGINDTLYNYIDFENKTLVRMVGQRMWEPEDEERSDILTDAITTIYPLDEVDVVDISQYLTFNGDIEVEGNGTLVFENELKLDAPSTVTYQTKIDISTPVYNNAEGGAY